MEERYWRRVIGGEFIGGEILEENFLKKSYWRRVIRGEFFEEELLEESYWRRDIGGEILEESYWRRDIGGELLAHFDLVHFGFRGFLVQSFRSILVVLELLEVGGDAVSVAVHLGQVGAGVHVTA